MGTTQANQTMVLRNADKEQLEQAVADNHRQLFSCNAKAVGGFVNTIDGLSYSWTTANGSAVAFPELSTGNVGSHLDAMMEDYRAHDATNIGYWSLQPPKPSNIGIYLLARGFQPGWQPCWMAVERPALQTGFAMPAGLEIRADNDTNIHDVAGLPYGDNHGAFSDALFKAYPGRAQRFVAWLDGVIVGQTCLFFTTGALGIAGMYNVGVLPIFQRRGIGKAIVAAACQFAFAKGYHYVMLNANHIGRRTYEQVGFRFISFGCTWWLLDRSYITRPPSPAIVLLAEATGKGNIAAMETAGKELTTQDLDEPLANGMTLIQLAAHFKQPAAAEWLLQQGAACTPLNAWDLGWKDRAAALLNNDPAVVNRTYYDFKGTLLHIAAERNDTELAKLALQAGVDLSIKDIHHDSTGMGWAQYFGRFAIMALIKDRQLKAGETQ
ncbi:GNAT family N-acetyltransferase [Paraflavitalea sp. CAU 1676]|uniref:GNAT family N-acetyltransferase n=1 Tax=Paraflavitalea sp. CAU 1676 TaxID=3032598 RepID=UPI0023D9C89C|nr:GNAT family N-acetyltransferase [Paraflavitalea sp. CAU 1676]MDF2188041.1 GNAT family N-acetyltransferase [Paraflavitalea sp. CAU 1676]